MSNNGIFEIILTGPDNTICLVSIPMPAINGYMKDAEATDKVLSMLRIGFNELLNQRETK